jgi:hypothetical protein
VALALLRTKLLITTHRNHNIQDNNTEYYRGHMTLYMNLLLRDGINYKWAYQNGSSYRLSSPPGLYLRIDKIGTRGIISAVDLSSMHPKEVLNTSGPWKPGAEHSCLKPISLPGGMIPTGYGSFVDGAVRQVSLLHAVAKGDGISYMTVWQWDKEDPGLTDIIQDAMNSISVV